MHKTDVNTEAMGVQAKNAVNTTMAFDVRQRPVGIFNRADCGEV